MGIIKNYRLFLENLKISQTFLNILDYLKEKKKNKVAGFLSMLFGYDYYKDDEDLNYLSTSIEDNMISYLTKRNRTNDYIENLTSGKRSSIRVGRAIKKIYEKIKPILNLNISDEANIIRSSNIENKYYIDFERNYYFFYLNEYYLIEIDETKKAEVRLKVDGEYYNCELLEFTCEPTTMVLKIENFIKCPTVSTYEWDSYFRRKSKFTKNVEVELKSNFSLSDSDIEKFANEYVSFVKANRSDETSKIEEVKGEDIRYWYSIDNYQSYIGKLGNSCMSHNDCSEFLDIYVLNKDVVSLLILKNKNNKLVGRSLLWKLDDGRIFMDRVYTSNDGDDNIFINYAIDNGYLYRNTSSQNIKYYKDGKEIPKEKMTVTLKNYEHDYYPYLDTLCYLSKGVLSNISSGFAKELNETDGGWSSSHDNENNSVFDDDE